MVIYTGSPPGVANSPTGTLLTTLTGVTRRRRRRRVRSRSPPRRTVRLRPPELRAMDGSRTAGRTAEIEFTCGVGGGEASLGAGVSLGGTVYLTLGHNHRWERIIMASFDVQLDKLKLALTAEVLHKPQCSSFLPLLVFAPASMGPVSVPRTRACSWRTSLARLAGPRLWQARRRAARHYGGSCPPSCGVRRRRRGSHGAAGSVRCEQP